jgi:hypothetical protein
MIQMSINHNLLAGMKNYDICILSNYIKELIKKLIKNLKSNI